MTFEAFHSNYQSLVNFPVRKADTEKMFADLREGKLEKLSHTALLAAGYPPIEYKKGFWKS